MTSRQAARFGRYCLARSSEHFVWLRHIHDTLRQNEARAELFLRPGKHRVPGLRLLLDQSGRSIGAVAQQISAKILCDLGRDRLRCFADRIDHGIGEARESAYEQDRLRRLAHPIPRQWLQRARARAPQARAALASKQVCRRAILQYWRHRYHPYAPVCRTVAQVWPALPAAPLRSDRAADFRKSR